MRCASCPLQLSVTKKTLCVGSHYPDTSCRASRKILKSRSNQKTIKVGKVLPSSLIGMQTTVTDGCSWDQTLAFPLRGSYIYHQTHMTSQHRRRLESASYGRPVSNLTFAEWAENLWRRRSGWFWGWSFAAQGRWGGRPTSRSSVVESSLLRRRSASKSYGYWQQTFSDSGARVKRENWDTLKPSIRHTVRE